ncbi:hypothetical protein HDU97_009412 [Phlyctochytrium planicorne]|nr:hypothetical protein HDU97_009412 [Phlyctochytrium planicorne]
MRAECLLARRLRESELPTQLPAAEIEPFGCVAVVDISGYTQLTDKLAALGGIDRIKDVLNPPFELIINAVHKRFGSVVKLAGDSAIVVWTIPPRLKEECRKSESNNTGDIDKQGLEYVCNLALLCCMELLELFESYEVILGARSSYQSSDHRAGETISRKVSTTRSTATGSEEDPSVPGPKPSLKRYLTQSSAASSTQPKISKFTQKLRLHIGLGFGEVQHVFVGCGSVDTRAEYFIAGNALHDAGIMLNKGRSGQLVFRRDEGLTIDCWSLAGEFSRPDSDQIYIENRSGFHKLKSSLNSLVLSYNSNALNEEDLPSIPVLDDKVRSIYIEPSLKKHISSSPNTYVGVLENAMTKANVYSDNMNQYRAITVLFLRLPNIPVNCMGSSKAVLEDVQFVAEKAIEIVSKYGGTCRQIHADEKALSVLLVWGVEGFTHEKGDSGYAVSAGMEIEKTLKSRKWCHDASKNKSAENISTHNFSLAITMGKA